MAIMSRAKVRHQALVPWPTEAIANTSIDRVFTLDLREKRVDHHKAVVVLGELADVTREAGQLIAADKV
jgi:hypothetical protein